MKNYRHTIRASYLGCVTQAAVNNLAPLLFLTFQNSYGITLEQIGFLITINFGVQMFVDLIAAKYVDRIGYRISIVAAHILCAGGLMGLGILPNLFAVSYLGLLVSIVLYAIGGGLIEVLISPIVEACPTENKSSEMSLLHSFYCWGHVAVVLLSTLFFKTAGIENWPVLTALWALLPLGNAIYFCFVPIQPLVEEAHHSLSIRNLFSLKTFWILALLMVCAGASEQAMSQWASAFAESGLHVSKTMGDLLGPCFFAVLMGTSRLLYARLSHRISLQKGLILSGLLCLLSYALTLFSPFPLLSLLGCGLCGFSVGILWPGTFSLASIQCPTGGTAMFALLALAGDLGCLSGPGTVGIVSDWMGGNLKSGLLIAMIFPVVLVIGVRFLKKAPAQRVKQE